MLIALLSLVHGRRGGYYGAEDVWHLTPYARHPEAYRRAGGGVVEPRRMAGLIPVYHFKWHQGVLQSASDRLAHYGGAANTSGGLPRYNHFVESRNLLNRLRAGKIDLQVRSPVERGPLMEPDGDPARWGCLGITAVHATSRSHTRANGHA